MKKLIFSIFAVVLLTVAVQAQDGNPRGTSRDFWFRPVTVNTSQIKPNPTVAGTVIVADTNANGDIRYTGKAISEVLGESGMQRSGVFYVAENGNNSTAEEGNPVLPYATLAGAVADYTSGGIIYVTRGEYSESLNLGTGSVNLYLEDGATISGVYVSPIADSIEVNISGNGNILSPSGSLFRTRFNSNLRIEAKTIAVTGNLIFCGNGYAHIKADSIAILATEAIRFPSNDSTGRTLDIVARVINAESDIWNQYGLYSTTMPTKWSVSSDVLWQSGAIISSNMGLSGSQIEFNFGTIYQSGNNLVSYFSLEDRKVDSTNITFNVGTLHTDNPLIGYWFRMGNGTGTGYFNININCNDCRYTGSIDSQVFGGAGALSGAHPKARLRINGNYVSVNKPFIETLTTTGWGFTLMLNVNIETLASGISAITLNDLADNTLQVSNTRIITNAGNAIEATLATAQSFMGTYTNDTTADAEVTENGQAIVRSATFKN